MSAFNSAGKIDIQNFITLQSVLLKHVSQTGFKSTNTRIENEDSTILFEPRKGICGMLEFLRSKLSLPTGGHLDDMRNECFKTWKYFTGSYSYPVPSSIDGDTSRSSEYAFDNYNHWEGQQLELRKDLIAHSIKYAKAKMKELYGV